MRRLLILIVLIFISFLSNAQNDINSYLKDFDLQSSLKKQLKFATVYGAVNGGTSISDAKIFSVTSGELKEELIETPYDYSITVGIRKIARCHSYFRSFFIHHFCKYFF